jgi:L-ascorbate metabolism protein UlaG (beta-lactamase superfamily)
LEISWLGGDALLLRGKDARVLLAPHATPVPSAVDIVVGGGEDQNVLRPESGPQVVARPGEYELRGVTVRGVLLGGGPVFVATVDDVPVLALGRWPGRISDEAVEQLGVIDVLALSLAGGEAVGATRGAALVGRLEPAVVVPVGYEPAGAEVAPALAAFLKEMGVSEPKFQPRLNLTGFQGGSQESRVVVLEARR